MRFMSPQITFKKKYNKDHGICVTTNRIVKTFKQLIFKELKIENVRL
jgi:hypothetical protein